MPNMMWVEDVVDAGTHGNISPCCPVIMGVVFAEAVFSVAYAQVQDASYVIGRGIWRYYSAPAFRLALKKNAGLGVQIIIGRDERDAFFRYVSDLENVRVRSIKDAKAIGIAREREGVRVSPLFYEGVRVSPDFNDALAAYRALAGAAETIERFAAVKVVPYVSPVACFPPRENTPRERIAGAARLVRQLELDVQGRLQLIRELCSCAETDAEVGAVQISVTAELRAVGLYLCGRAEIDGDKL
jgi:hypothetical protein